MGQGRVVLLHGIWRTGKSMAFIAWFLRRRGYDVLNLTYPSTRLPLEQLIESIHPAIRDFAGVGAADEGGEVAINTPRLHFVCHSMGGLLARGYIAKYRPPVGRVVMLGTPNHGSEVADFLKDWRLYRHAYGPAGQQITTRDAGIDALFAPVDFELGVIAGDRSLDKICSRIIGQPNDGKVSIASTKIEGMKAHRIVPSSHLMLTYRRSVMGLVERFLGDGEF